MDAALTTNRFSVPLSSTKDNPWLYGVQETP